MILSLKIYLNKTKIFRWSKSRTNAILGEHSWSVGSLRPFSDMPENFNFDRH